MVGSPLKKQRSSIPGEEENALEIPGAVYGTMSDIASARQGAISEGSGLSTTGGLGVPPNGGMGKSQETRDMGGVGQQSLAAATALPDEDEEL